MRSARNGGKERGTTLLHIRNAMKVQIVWIGVVRELHKTTRDGLPTRGNRKDYERRRT